MNTYKNKFLASLVLNAILVISMVCVYHVSKGISVDTIDDKCSMDVSSTAKAGQYVFQSKACMVQAIIAK